MSGYYWPSWCSTHRRPHVSHRWLCLTNRDRRHMRRALARFREQQALPVADLSGGDAR